MATKAKPKIKKKMGRPKGSKNVYSKDNPKPKIKSKRSVGGQPENKNAEKWTEDIATKIGHDLINWMKESNKNVFYDEFLYINNDYHPDLIGNLSEKFTSFSELIKKAAKIQETKLRLYCGNGKLHPTMSIFCLKNNHNYTDKNDLMSGGKTIKDTKIQVEIIK